MIRRTRVSGLLLKGEEVLIVEHQKKEKSYFLLPGGGIKEGETIDKSLKREFLEEVGIEIELGRLLYLSDTIYPDNSKQIHHLVFQVFPVKENYEIQSSQDKQVKSVRWLPYKKLVEVEFYPPFAQEIVDFIEGKLTDYGAIYLGKLWR